MVSYFLLLEKESLCPSCQHFDAINSSLKKILFPRSISVAPRELLEPSPDSRKAIRNGRWFRSAKLLVSSLSNCSSVKTCSRAWSFLAILFRPHPRFRSIGTRTPLQAAWKALADEIAVKLAHLRQVELHQLHQHQLPELSRGRERSERKPSETSSVLLLSADSESYFHRPSVAPFIRQLRCYAQRRKMRLVLDGGPWPLTYFNVGLQAPYTWTVHWTGTATAGTAGTGEARALEEQCMRNLMVDLVSKRQLQRASELLSWNRLNVYSEDPAKMTKIWSIQRQLEGNASMVVYLDTDVIIRPDSLHSGLVPLLLLHDSTSNRSSDSSDSSGRPGRPGRPGRRPSDIFVRDSHPGTECVNIGFLAVRNTRATQLLLELWRQKSHWSAFWDQSALAESLLELVGMEMQNQGQIGYRSQCLRFLFPEEFGEVPYNAYCDCWQDALRNMIGPYRQRRSRVVSFVDPEELDVNFVPNDVFWDHGFTLEGMRLVSSDINEIMHPLIIHWAGVGNQDMRLHFVSEYLKRQFNTSFSKGTCSRLTRSTTRSTRPRMAPPRFNSHGRLVRCCRNLQKEQQRLALVDFRQMCYWGCCEWRPIKAADCHKLMATRSERRTWQLSLVKLLNVAQQPWRPQCCARAQAAAAVCAETRDETDKVNQHLQSKEFDRWSDDDTQVKATSKAKERDFDTWSEVPWHITTVVELEQKEDQELFFTDAAPDHSLLGVEVRLSPRPPKAPPPAHLLQRQAVEWLRKKAEVPVQPPQPPAPAMPAMPATVPRGRPVPPPPRLIRPGSVQSAPVVQPMVHPVVQPMVRPVQHVQPQMAGQQVPQTMPQVPRGVRQVAVTPVVLVPVSPCATWSCFLSLQHGLERMKLFATLLLGDATTAQALVRDANANLKLSHRTSFEDVKKAALKAVLQLVPMTDVKDQQARDSLEKYLLSKDRAGVVRVGLRDLYLIPPSKAEDCGLKVVPQAKCIVAAVAEKSRSTKKSKNTPEVRHGETESNLEHDADATALCPSNFTWTHLRSITFAMHLSFRRCLVSGSLAPFADFVPRAIFNFDNHPHWFVGHMSKGKDVDVILEVRDARAPFTSAQFELTGNLSDNVQRLVVLNKADLVTPTVGLAMRTLARLVITTAAPAVSKE
eukprot:s830_g30.t2